MAWIVAGFAAIGGLMYWHSTTIKSETWPPVASYPEEGKIRMAIYLDKHRLHGQKARDFMAHYTLPSAVVHVFDDQLYCVNPGTILVHADLTASEIIALGRVKAVTYRLRIHIS